MDGPGAGSSADGGPAVVVPVEPTAPAAAPAAAPPPPARWTTRVSEHARVMWAGAPARSASAAGAGVAKTRLMINARLTLAAALFLLGCAAAGLAFFAMILPSTDSLLGKVTKACGGAPTDAEVAGLRAASEYLLLAASAQVLAATVALLMPTWPVSAFGSLLGTLTAYRATQVLWMLVVVGGGGCHGGDNLHGGAMAFHFWLFCAVRWVAVVVALFVSIRW